MMIASMVTAEVEEGSEDVNAPPPPRMKAATISAKNASALSKLVKFWILLPQTIPRHWSTAKKIATAAATAAAFPLSAGMSAPEKVPITNATAAVEPHDEIQSLQPTINPAYSPSAYRENTY